MIGILPELYKIVHAKSVFKNEISLTVQTTNPYHCYEV